MLANGILEMRELDAALRRVGQDQPFNTDEQRLVTKSLQYHYNDRSNPNVDDAYVQRTFMQGLVGNPDSVKLGWGGRAEGTDHVLEIKSGAKAAMEEMATRIAMTGTRNTDALVHKDALTTAATGSTGGGVLVNQSISPQLALWFNTQATALADLQYEEAQGLDYEWDNMLTLSTGLDGWIGEDGCPPDDHGVYFRGKTNVGMLGIARRTSLRLDLAVRAGGVLFNGGMGPYELQMMSAMIHRAILAETTYFQGTTASTKDGTDEYGLSMSTDAFNGWRVLVSGNANIVHGEFYPAGTYPNIFEAPTTGTAPITKTIRKAITACRNNGGIPDRVYMTYSMADLIAEEWVPSERILSTSADGFTAGVTVSAIAHPSGPVPIIAVPDDRIGQYAASSIGTPTINGKTLPGTTLSGTVQDIYVASRGSLRKVGLGPEDPAALEIPYGYGLGDGTECFTRRLIVYIFLGFAMLVPIHQAKVRVKIA